MQTMTNEEAKQYIIDHARDYLTPDRSGHGWICPVDGKSGTGPNGTGITSRDGGRHYTCWAGCFTNADIIDIIGIKYGLTDYKDKFAKACEEFGITTNGGGGYSRRSTPQEDFGQGVRRDPPPTQPQPQPQPQEDFSAFYLEANKNLDKTDYHRGISRATLDRFRVGYVDTWAHPKTPQHTSPRLILPINDYCYTARDTRAEIPPAAEKHKKAKVKAAGMDAVSMDWTFNRSALQESTRPLFVVEGEIDAMSIIDVGGEAVGLGGISSIKSFLSLLAKHPPSQPLIIAMDNDTENQAGQEAAKKLDAGMAALNIPHYMINVFFPHKDANEALTADRENFQAAVAMAEETAREYQAEEEAAELEQIQSEAASHSIAEFVQAIHDRSGDCIPTGFKDLDELLDGGLYAGLYTIGAISSLGKTTFCLQLADQIAQGGRDVLIFSLEMAKYELMAKSVSRLTYLQAVKDGDTRKAKTTRGVLVGSKYQWYSEAERQLIQVALDQYAEYAGHIYITEGMGNVGTEQIRREVDKRVKRTGKAPVIIIDYVQIIAPAEEDRRASDKQITDRNVLALKRMSRDYNIPVVGISSFNRDNYTSPVNLTSFKESGAIEYSSDVLIGLQYAGMDYAEGEKDAERDKRIRSLRKKATEDANQGRYQSIQVKILKSRNGRKGDLHLDFYPKFNCFTEEQKAANTANGADWLPVEGSYK